MAPLRRRGRLDCGAGAPGGRADIMSARLSGVLMGLLATIPASPGHADPRDFRAHASFVLTVQRSPILGPGVSRLETQSTFVSLARRLDRARRTRAEKSSSSRSRSRTTIRRSSGEGTTARSVGPGTPPSRSIWTPGAASGARLRHGAGCGGGGPEDHDARVVVALGHGVVAEGDMFGYQREIGSRAELERRTTRRIGIFRTMGEALAFLGSTIRCAYPMYPGRTRR
jgi:hypothetical protein